MILGFLSIFSAKYRRWAKEAFNCVTKRITLRPCETGFNTRVKAKVTSKLLKHSTIVARFTNKHFELISWIFTLLFFISIGITFFSIYNLAVHGSCDPTSSTCIFNPGHEAICGNPECKNCSLNEKTECIDCGCETCETYNRK